MEGGREYMYTYNKKECIAEVLMGKLFIIQIIFNMLL